MTEQAARFDGSTLLTRQVLDELQHTDAMTAAALAHVLGAPYRDVQTALDRLLDSDQVTLSGSFWSAA